MMSVLRCLTLCFLLVQVFVANKNDFQIAVINFNPPLSDVTAIRVYPKTSSQSTQETSSLRVDVSGCFEEKTIVTTTKVVTTETTGQQSTTTSKPVVEETTTFAPVEVSLHICSPGITSN